MFRFLPSLLLGMLLTTACSTKNDEPAPEASLDGTWHQTHFHSLHYNADGTLRRDEGRVPADPVFVFEFTGDTLRQARFERTPTGTFLRPMINGGYSRTGNTLTIKYARVPTDQYQITKLNGTTLIVENTSPAPNAGTYKFISEFERQ